MCCGVFPLRVHIRVYYRRVDTFSIRPLDRRARGRRVIALSTGGGGAASRRIWESIGSRMAS